jgi:hypothetical protein
MQQGQPLPTAAAPILMEMEKRQQGFSAFSFAEIRLFVALPEVRRLFRFTGQNIISR